MTTEADITYFQHVPDAQTGDIVDSLTMNNNFSVYGKMQYFEAFGNPNLPRIDLFRQAVFPNTIAHNTLTDFTWQAASLPNTTMWTSGSNIYLPTAGVYAASVRIAFRGLGTGSPLPGTQVSYIRLIENDGVTIINNIAVRGVNQMAVDITFSSTGFTFASAGQFIRIQVFQTTGVSQTCFGNLQIRKLPIFMEVENQ